MLVYEAKRWLVSETGIPDAEMHFLIGLFLFLGLWALTKKPWVSAGLVAVVETANEANDLYVFHAFSDWLKWQACGIDMWGTLAAPVALAILVTIRLQLERSFLSRTERHGGL